MGRFAVVGAAGFAVDAGLLSLLVHATEFGPYAARVPSFLAAVTLTWWYNRTWTFADRPRKAESSQWIRYVLVMVVGALINYGTYALLVATSAIVAAWPAIGVAAGSAAGMTINYLGASILVFGVHGGASEVSRSTRGTGIRRLWETHMNRPGVLIAACVFVPLLCGLLSLLYGQDSNWDLRNYHLYNAYAWLNGRIGSDLAPAGLQSYFNPLLDVPYFLLVQHWPAPLVGFFFGWLHGLSFVLVAGIARSLLVGHPSRDRLSLLLALAGLTSTAFLSQLGGTMGDNLTALFVLAAVLIAVTSWRRLDEAGLASIAIMLSAGLLIGLGTGLKLTNAIYAVALCVAILFTSPPGLRGRFALAASFAAGGAAGLGITGGFWHYRLWREFGNPLFPQFNAWFSGPLASDIAIADTRWYPGGLAETVLWPLIMTLDASRVGDKPLEQLLWAVFYLLFAWWVIAALSRRSIAGEPAAGRHRFMLTFIALGFVIWMGLFSIHRYLVPLELLAPLGIWILAHRLLQARPAGRVAGGLIIICALYSLVNSSTWGHQPWARDAFRVEPPALEATETATFLLADREPLAWMIPYLPADAVYVSLGSFPESHEYRKRAEAIIARRGGPVIALVELPHSRGARRIRRLNSLLEGRGIESGDRICTWLRQLAAYSGSIEPAPADASCRFQRSDDRVETAAEDKSRRIDRVADILARYGLRLESARCTEYQAYIGRTRQPYLACQVDRQT